MKGIISFLLVVAIGVLIAYIINDDNHHRRVKWAWVGFGIFVAVLLLVSALAARSTVQ